MDSFPESSIESSVVCLVSRFLNHYLILPRFSINAFEISYILEVAVKTKTTFYDSSYINVRNSEVLKLINDDLDLRRRAAGENVTVFELVDVF